MVIQSTIHCNYRECHRWAPYDPDSSDELPEGWIQLFIGTGKRPNRQEEFCGAGHVANWIAETGMQEIPIPMRRAFAAARPEPEPMTTRTAT